MREKGIDVQEDMKNMIEDLLIVVAEAEHQSDRGALTRPETTLNDLMYRVRVIADLDTTWYDGSTETGRVCRPMAVGGPETCRLSVRHDSRFCGKGPEAHR